MESFRVRHSNPGRERTLLLPLSFGVGSFALLHVLSQHLKGQAEKTGRTGFKLHILHVEEAASGAGNPADLERVKQHYPEHTYSYSLLSDVSFLEDVQNLLKPGYEDNTPTIHGASDSDKFNRFLDSLDSATSRADAKDLLKRRLIVRFAKHHYCEAILWGDSTTRLAERTLAETAKARGFSLPWIIADGESPHGIQFYYPMRELLSKEIEAFASLVDPPLDDLVLEEKTKPVVSTKNTTIDDLMKQYFESVQQEYPSILANVVKTASKLQAAPLRDVETQCELCEMPLDGQAPKRSRLCNGCIRTLSHG